MPLACRYFNCYCSRSTENYVQRQHSSNNNNSNNFGSHNKSIRNIDIGLGQRQQQQQYRQQQALSNQPLAFVHATFSAQNQMGGNHLPDN